jgi:hypothetical protein
MPDHFKERKEMKTNEIFGRIIEIIETDINRPFIDPKNEEAFQHIKECSRQIEKTIGEDFFE